MDRQKATVTAQATPLFFRQKRIGALARNIAKLAQTAPQVFRASAEGFHLIVTTPQEASESLNALLKTWRQAGVLSRWRGEQLDVLDPETFAPLFPLEREGRVLLGLMMTGAILNGVVFKSGAPHLWIAQRAANKSIAPLQWDCLANGAVGAGEMPAVALAREAWEEAGVPAELAAHAIPAAQFTIEHREGEHVFYERAHCFDLVLPDTFSPANNDGEVERFECVSRGALLSVLRQGNFTQDAKLAIESWLTRHPLTT
jgi:8-oxo-dGTP pyrophosphatase MutT (NUDIX family)